MFQSQLSNRSPARLRRYTALRARDVRLEQPLLEQLRRLGAPREHHDLVVPVERPGVEIDGAKADDVVRDDDLGVDDRAGKLPELDSRLGEVAVVMLQRGRRLRVVRRLRDDETHRDAATGRGKDPADHVCVRDVRVHHVEPPARAVDLLAERLGGGDVAAGDHLRERDRRRALVRGCGEVRGEVGPERAAVPAKARQERRLRLPDDGAGHPHHDVVEAAVLEVILDPRSAGPGDGAVDHVQLAVVGAAHLVLTPVDALAVGEETVAVEREDVVDDDLRARVGEAR